MLLLKPDADFQKAGFDSFDSKDRILYGAMKLIASKGLEAASTRAIANASNLTIGMIWKLYGSKENLLGEIDSHIIRTIGTCFERMPEVDVENVPHLWMGVGGDLANENQLEFSYFRRAISDNNPSAYRLLSAYVDHCFKYFDRLKRSGHIKKDANLKDLALTTVMLGIGVLVAGPLISGLDRGKTHGASIDGTWNQSNLALFTRGVLETA